MVVLRLPGFEPYLLQTQRLVRAAKDDTFYCPRWEVCFPVESTDEQLILVDLFEDGGDIHK